MCVADRVSIAHALIRIANQLCPKTKYLYLGAGANSASRAYAGAKRSYMDIVVFFSFSFPWISKDEHETQFLYASPLQLHFRMLLIIINYLRRDSLQDRWILRLLLLAGSISFSPQTFYRCITRDIKRKCSITFSFLAISYKEDRQ